MNPVVLTFASDASLTKRSWIVCVTVWLAIISACVVIESSNAIASPENVAITITVSPPPLTGQPTGGAWATTTPIFLTHDLTYRKPDKGEVTAVYLLADKDYLYVGFDVKQDVGVTDTQVTNGSGTGIDDSVGIVLWPEGRSGLQYAFTSNPSGAHFQSSSENTAFEPNWRSIGKRTHDGYAVTMAIPLNVMRANAGDVWPMQIYRYVAQTKQLFVWSYDPAESPPLEVQYAGSLTGMSRLSQTASSRLPARVAIYGLVEAQPASYGGPTSRIGADYSIPVARTVSIFGTIHPDYSNVEVDQQSIAPTEFERVYYEVRPFFTQAASFYNPSGFSDLYTPSVPTPSWGVAYEGTGDGVQSAGFSASSPSRNDNAQVVSLSNASQTATLAFQRVQANLTDVQDTTTTSSLSYNNNRDFAVYGSFANDDGTNVLDYDLNKNIDIGTTYYGPKWSLAMNYLSTGLYYNPVDGYVQHPDVEGFNYAAHREFDYSPRSAIQSVTLDGYLDSYKNHLGQLDQTDIYASVGIVTKRRLSISLSTGSNYLLEEGYGLTPFTQQGIAIGYAINPALPNDVGYRFGHYFYGYLQSLYTDETFQLGKPSRTLLINYYRTNYVSAMFQRQIQTLFRISSNVQYSRTGSFSIGWRLIVGSPPGFFYIPPTRQVNFSAGIAQRLQIGDLYIVYGDPNSVYTTPSLIVKLVHYLVGQKGT